MFKKFDVFAGNVAAFLLFLLMLVTLVDVTGRDLFNKPLSGATEMTELLMAGMAFLLYPNIATAHKHIVVDLIDGISGPVLRMLQQTITALIGAGLFSVMAWRLWLMAERSMGYAEATATLQVPIGPVYYFMAALAVVTAAAFLATIPAAIRLLKEPSKIEAGLELI